MECIFWEVYYKEAEPNSRQILYSQIEKYVMYLPNIWNTRRILLHMIFI